MTKTVWIALGVLLTADLCGSAASAPEEEITNGLMHTDWFVALVAVETGNVTFGAEHNQHGDRLPRPGRMSIRETRPERGPFFDEVVIPEAVAGELRRSHPALPGFIQAEAGFRLDPPAQRA